MLIPKMTLTRGHSVGVQRAGNCLARGEKNINLVSKVLQVEKQLFL